MAQAELEVAGWVRSAAAGDAGAWRSLVEAYSGRVFGLLVKQCGDRDLAEELTQVTFVKVVEQLAGPQGYQEQGRFEPWLFRVAMNKLRDEMRRRKRQAVSADFGPGSERDDAGWAAPADEGGEGSLGENPQAVLDRAEQVGRLREAVAGLPEADREVLHLRHTAGLSFAEIAATLEQPLGTVLARGHRALKKLKKMMQETGDEAA
ncbi:MAG: sigma-70 family RNA polymerase sigma factor [Planctomycetota bacterium]